MIEVDYQELILLVTNIVKLSLPFGIIMGLSEWTVMFFLKCVFPKHFRKD